LRGSSVRITMYIEGQPNCHLVRQDPFLLLLFLTSFSYVKWKIRQKKLDSFIPFENWIAKVMTKFKKPERIMINQMMVHFWGEYGLVCSCSMSLCKAKYCGWAVYRWKAWTFHLDIVLTIIWNLPHDWMLFNHFVYPSPS
jgi:hypothetical protein